MPNDYSFIVHVWIRVTLEFALSVVENRGTYCPPGLGPNMYKYSPFISEWPEKLGQFWNFPSLEMKRMATCLLFGISNLEGPIYVALMTIFLCRFRENPIFDGRNLFSWGWVISYAICYLCWGSQLLSHSTGATTKTLRNGLLAITDPV